MTVLLDTHLWLWWLLGSPQLPSRERQAIDQAAQARQLRLAAISLWEAQLLQAKGRLQLDRPFEHWLRRAAAADVITVLPLDCEVVICVNSLPADFQHHSPQPGGAALACGVIAH
ncbi:MAG: type II toxin-antitoxin system VapC family toxin [Cyanobacteria bacterium]|nr:type II toxin-antitoxin system VapC family toxin [Cyanobacteriota bacterium]